MSILIAPVITNLLESMSHESKFGTWHIAMATTLNQVLNYKFSQLIFPLNGTIILNTAPTPTPMPVLAWPIGYLDSTFNISYEEIIAETTNAFSLENLFDLIGRKITSTVTLTNAYYSPRKYPGHQSIKGTGVCMFNTSHFRTIGANLKLAVQAYGTNLTMEMFYKEFDDHLTNAINTIMPLVIPFTGSYAQNGAVNNTIMMTGTYTGTMTVKLLV